MKKNYFCFVFTLLLLCITSTSAFATITFTTAADIGSEFYLAVTGGPSLGDRNPIELVVDGAESIGENRWKYTKKTVTIMGGAGTKIRAITFDPYQFTTGIKPEPKDARLTSIVISEKIVEHISVNKPISSEYPEKLTELDLSACPNLRSLFCANHNLSTLDLSSKKYLYEVACNNNILQEIKVCPSLGIINCSNNQLKTIDISSLIEVEELYCNGNRLESIVLPKKASTIYENGTRELFYIDISNNCLKEEAMKYIANNLDNENAGNLTTPYICVLEDVATECNEIYSAEYYKLAYTGRRLRIKVNGELKPYEYAIEKSDFTFRTEKNVGETISLTISAPIYYQSLLKLEGITREGGIELGKKVDYTIASQDIKIIGPVNGLVCDNNNIDAMDISNAVELRNLDCRNNQMSSLKIRNDIRLENLNCSNNDLTMLEFVEVNPSSTQKGSIGNLTCTNNLFTQLNLANLTVGDLNCSNNNLLTQLGFTQTTVMNIDCTNCIITQLDLTNTGCTSLYCSDNKLTSLILDPNPTKWYDVVDCKNNLLTELALTCAGKLDCSNNKLTKFTSIKMTNNPKDIYCKEFICNNNELTELSLNNVAPSEKVDCSNNKLTKINYMACIAKNTNLKNNELTLLDLSPTYGTVEINKLDCSNNKLVDIVFPRGGVSPYSYINNMDCSNNDFNSLTVNFNVDTINCSNNKLTELKFEDTRYTHAINCENNELEMVDFTSCLSLSKLKCNNNQLTNIVLPDPEESKPRVESYDFECYSNKIKSAEMEAFIKRLATISRENQGFNLSGTIKIVNQDKTKEENEAYDYIVKNIISKGWTVKNSYGSSYDGAPGPYVLMSTNAPADSEIMMSISYLEGMAPELEGIEPEGGVIENGVTMPYIVKSPWFILMKGTGIVNIEAQECQLNNVNLGSSSELVYVNLSGNQINKLTVMDGENISTLDITENNLNEFDISSLINLENLYCSYNDLGSLNLDKLTKLKRLECSENGLTLLDLRKNIALKEVDADRNKLQWIGLSGLANLSNIMLSENQLTSIDLSGLTNLNKLMLYSNKLSSIDLSKNTKLSNLILSKPVGGINSLKNVRK